MSEYLNLKISHIFREVNKFRDEFETKYIYLSKRYILF